MKEGIHPEGYRYVVFRDVAANTSWLSRSTVKTDRTTQWEDGSEYPLYDLPISRYSHPFFTGAARMIDTEGRVEKFKKKYAKK
ncbi:MAG: type B 50S ribosomal protein L31 [Deltaproteobacteria bacterium]|nr:type B 50S ribosomal protein L31 [Deltaproteobacteria bacterium]